MHTLETLTPWELSDQTWRELLEEESDPLQAELLRMAEEGEISRKAVLDGEKTSGLGLIIDWGTLEDALEAGEYPNKKAFWTVVREQFAKKGFFLKDTDRRTRAQVIAGMFEDYRAIYEALPNTGTREAA